MSAKTVEQSPVSAQPPPVVPDPELIDHIEGNERIIKKNKAAARAYVDELKAAGQIADGIAG